MCESGGSSVGNDFGVCEAVIREAVCSGKLIEEVLEEYSLTREDISSIGDGDVLASAARRAAEAEIPYVWSALLSSAKKGNVPAIKLYFELWNKNRTASPDTRASDEIDSLREDVFGGDEDE